MTYSNTLQIDIIIYEFGGKGEDDQFTSQQMSNLVLLG